MKTIKMYFQIHEIEYFGYNVRNFLFGKSILGIMQETLSLFSEHSVFCLV